MKLGKGSLQEVEDAEVRSDSDGDVVAVRLNGDECRCYFGGFFSGF